MNVRISPGFWSDPEIEELTADMKLAALWLMTNSRTTVFGYVEISERRFEFETGSPWQALLDLCKAHAKGFVKTGKGFWVRRFISHQIGTGKKLIDNNFCRALVRDLRGYSDEPVYGLVMEEYPELIPCFDVSDPDSDKALSKGLPSPRAEKSREEQRRAESEIDKTTSKPDAADFAKFWAAYPRKVGKGAALKAWEKTRKLRPEIGAVLSALDRCTESDQWVKDGGQFIPHPATWLNELRFADFDPVDSEKNKKTAGPEGWQEALAELLPDMHCPEHWGSLPETIRDGLIEALENRKKNKKEGAE
jgi:hypothetical protein